MALRESRPDTTVTKAWPIWHQESNQVCPAGRHSTLEGSGRCSHRTPTAKRGFCSNRWEAIPVSYSAGSTQADQESLVPAWNPRGIPVSGFRGSRASCRVVSNEVLLDSRGLSPHFAMRSSVECRFFPHRRRSDSRVVPHPIVDSNIVETNAELGGGKKRIPQAAPAK